MHVTLYVNEIIDRKCWIWDYRFILRGLYGQVFSSFQSDIHALRRMICKKVICVSDTYSRAILIRHNFYKSFTVSKLIATLYCVTCKETFSTYIWNFFCFMGNTSACSRKPWHGNYNKSCIPYYFLFCGNAFGLSIRESFNAARPSYKQFIVRQLFNIHSFNKLKSKPDMPFVINTLHLRKHMWLLQ